LAKSRDFSYPLHSTPLLGRRGGGPTPVEIAIMFDLEKLEWWGYTWR